MTLFQTISEGARLAEERARRTERLPLPAKSRRFSPASGQFVQRSLEVLPLRAAVPSQRWTLAATVVFSRSASWGTADPLSSPSRSRDTAGSSLQCGAREKID
jgi:hypothetical protein